MREVLPMPGYVDHVGPGLALPGLIPFDGKNGEEPHASSSPTLCEDFESLSIPIRGVVLAVLVSSLLWAIVILAGRGLWLLLR
jgi:hypothetical protein